MKNTSLLLFLIVVLLASCSKKNNNPNNNNIVTPVYGTYPSLDSVFNLLNDVPSKSAYILADSGGSVEGNSGTRYIFPKSAFADASGTDVTGNVQIEVNEWLKKGDMIFAKVLPVAVGGDALLSGGEIYINATQNGQQIYLKPAYSFQANIPITGKYDTSMIYFHGLPVSSPTNNRVNWMDTSEMGSVVYNGDTISIISDSLQFCNADQFLYNPKYQTFTVTIAVTGGAAINSSAIYTYAMYDNYKGVWPISGISGNTYSVNHVPNMPVHFVSFALIDGHFYGGVMGATPVNKGNYTVTLTEVDPASFKAQLNGLYP